MKKDIEIAREIPMLPITEIAKKLDLPEEYVLPYGRYKAKLDYEKIEDRRKAKNLILVTAINPTKAGEGKSTTTIALADGLARAGKEVLACLREPSLGPVFGLKGGATGGGYAQVVPMEEINLHFTGDFHAITTANNLVSAILDNEIYQGNTLNIDPERVVWKRCLDMNDRTLRDVTIAQKKKSNGVERPDHFCITVASEMMAIFCLARDLNDFTKRVSECIVAYTYDGKPVTIGDLGISGALAVLMKEAIKPNLVQTLEHTPVLIHGGPFANIAHGCNSVIATTTALKLADYVVTEAGFGADLGAEKFFDIKCRKAGLTPKCAVIVATCRALKLNGGVSDKELDREDVEAVLRGAANLEKHLDSLHRYGIPVVVAINVFAKDTDRELEALLNWCHEHGEEACLCEGYAQGSAGSEELTKMVLDACKRESRFHTLYPDDLDLRSKIEMIAREIYGADGVDFSELAEEKLQEYREYDRLPVCMAKTQMSLSDDPKVYGRPQNFRIYVRDLSVSRGAGFVVAYAGNILTMPGLPAHPAALDMGIDEEGNTYGIF